MSIIASVLKNKRDIKHGEELLRKKAINDKKKESIFKVKMYNSIQQINNLFKDPSLKEIDVEINPNEVTDFIREIYGSLAEYEVQINGTSARIARKEIKI